VSASISSLMQRQIRSIDMDDTVGQAAAMLASHGLSWAPVLDAARAVIGVISATDLLQFAARNGDPMTVRAWQLCTYKPISVDQATPLGEVARTMVQRQVHHVVVTDESGLVGVVSSLDFVRTCIDD
jgi:CBS domain-containing protein